MRRGNAFGYGAAAPAARRWVERAYDIGREAAAGWRRRQRSVRAQPERGGEASLTRLLAEGRFDEAEGRAQALQRALCDAGAPGMASSLPGLLQWWIAIGDQERARDAARAKEAVLAMTDEGALLLELLGVGSPRATLPSGRVNPRAIERLQEQGEPALDLLGRVGEPPGALVRDPERHLLAHNVLLVAGQKREAARALSRYLSARGLECAGPEGLAGGLERVRFARPTPAAPGPLVSVIVSAFRAAATVEYALESLRRQSYRNLEILVADDASDDATADVIAAVGRRDPRIWCFRSTANQGTYNVRNHLLQRCRGELVTFHDADDVALPSRIARQVAAMAKGRDLCVANWLRVRPDGRIVFFANGRASRLAVVSLMARRAVFDRLGPYRSARFGADLEYLRRAEALVGPTRQVRIRTPLLLGAWGASSLTRTAGAEALEDGYRSPARRAYSSAIARAGADVGQILEDTGNWIAPAGLEPID